MLGKRIGTLPFKENNLTRISMRGHQARRRKEEKT
jgi:hypothetical protein